MNTDVKVFMVDLELPTIYLPLKWPSGIDGSVCRTALHRENGEKTRPGYCIRPFMQYIQNACLVYGYLYAVYALFHAV